MRAYRLKNGLRAMISSLEDCAGWRGALVSAAAGALSILAFAPFFVTPILFLTLPILLVLLRVRSCPASNVPSLESTARVAWRGFAIAWWFGFGFHFAGLYWIGFAFLVQADAYAFLMPFALTLLPAGLAIFHGAAGLLTAVTLHHLFGDRRGRRSNIDERLIAPLVTITTFATALSMTEWLRGNIMTGFPWNILGYALTVPLEFMQSAAIVGIYGLTLAAVVVFSAPYILIAAGRALPDLDSWRAPVALSTALVAVPAAVAWGYGAYALSLPLLGDQGDARLRLVQPSIAQHVKFRRDKQREIFEEHLRLSRIAPDGKRDDLAGITHVIWPEASMPFLPLETPEALSGIGALLPSGTRLLAGALRRERTDDGGQKVLNSLIEFGKAGRVVSIYDKIHLVPFGEYLPLQATLEAIGLEAVTRQRGGFHVGPSPRPLFRSSGLVPMAVLICYEGIFPTEVIQGDERPRLLLNVTNDGWFGRSTGPYQHFHQSRLRAVELGLPLIRVGNNGVSGVIDARGRILSILDLDTKGVIDTRVPAASTSTVYAAFGDRVFFISWILFVALIAGYACRTRCSQ